MLLCVLPALLLAVGAANIIDDGYIVAPAVLAPSPYPEWAHYHWVWLSQFACNGSSDVLELAKDYLAHNISVGCVDIEPGWETGFNDFTINTNMFVNMSALVDDLHALNVRVILWVTSMINTDSPNYNDAYTNGYFVKDILGRQPVLSWWQGEGSLLDYGNADAVAWWHAQMDAVIALGIDGWKCDGTDPYIIEIVDPHSASGPITYRDYADSYYGDFFNYTRLFNDEALIMSRPCDGYGPIYLKYSPKYVMMSGWVGDYNDDFEGMQSALKAYLQSAWAGYANFGSDIGGYRQTPDSNRTADLFLRWSQLGAFSPLMENGGDGEHRPWLINTTQATFITDVYRNFVEIHYSLVPYLLTTGARALADGVSSITPLAPHTNIIDDIIDDFNPPFYDYLLGSDILVSPIINNGSNNLTFTKVYFLEGASWAYWFDHAKIYTGRNKSEEIVVPLSEYSAFLRVGAIIPLNYSISQRDIPNNVITLVVVAPQPGMTQSELREWKGNGLKFLYNFDNTTNELHFYISAHQSKQAVIRLELIESNALSVHVVDVVGNMHQLKQKFSSSQLFTESSYFIDNSNNNALIVFPGSLRIGVHVVIRNLHVASIDHSADL